MKLQVNASFQVNEHLNEVIEEKVNKLSQYFSPIVEADVYLKIGEKRHRQAEAQIVELRVGVPGHTFFAEEQSDTFEKSVAGAADKLRRQLVKHKDQLTSHH